MAQNKVKRLLAYSFIGHVSYLFIGFSCGTIEGIQSLLIGVFIYVLMTINVFAIVLALRQNRFKYIADLGALTKTNPTLAITLSTTMFSYARIPPLTRFCSNFFFFCCLRLWGLLTNFNRSVTSVISCFYYIRFVKIMYFDKPKTWILYKPMDCEKSLLLVIILIFPIWRSTVERKPDSIKKLFGRLRRFYLIIRMFGANDFQQIPWSSSFLVTGPQISVTGCFYLFSNGEFRFEKGS